MRKLYAAIAIGSAAVLALAGCGGGDNRARHDVDELVSTYGYQWEDTAAKIVNDEGAKELSYKVYAPKDGMADDYNEMKIMQTLEEQTNVSVVWDCVPQSSYDLQLMLEDHEGYDAIYHAGISVNDITYQADFGNLLCISDYLKYMPNLSAILEKRPDIKRQISCADDGKIYSLPRIEEMGLKQNPNLLFLNKKWAEKAIDANAVTGVTKDALKDGLQLNADQMEALLTYFKTHDMTGDGKTDGQYALSFIAQNWQGNQCDLFGMFGINENPDHRIVKNGKVTYTYDDEAYYDALSYIRGWVDKGLIDKYCFEQNEKQFLTNGQQGKYGAFYWWESKTVVANPDDYIVCAPLKGPQSYKGGKYANCQTVCVSNQPEIDVGELIIFADAPNVEVLLTYFDRYYAPETSAQINYGPIGVAFEEEKQNGMLVPKPVPEGKTADEFRLKNSPLGIIYLTAEQWGHTVKMEERAALRLDRLTKYATPYYNSSTSTVTVKPVPNLQFTIEEIEKLDQYTAIDTQMNNLVKFLYTSDLNETAWATFKSNVQKAGVYDVLKIYQAAYDRVK